MLNKLAAVLVVGVVVGCGATHVIGSQSSQSRTDGGTQIPECISHSECPGKLCDLGTCGTACGSNYPDAVCASEETCDGWRCRQTCAEGEACPAGMTCDADAVCRPSACGQDSPCPARYGCADGACVPVGNPCENSFSCVHPGLACDQGFCVLVCSDNAPNNICPLGQQCQNQLYCG